MHKFLSNTTLMLSVIIDEQTSATVKFAELKRGGSVFYTDDAVLYEALIAKMPQSNKYTYKGEVDDVNADEAALGGVIRESWVNYTNNGSVAPGKQVQSDWDQTNTSSPDYIKHKPTIPSSLSQLTDDTTHRVVTDTEKAAWNGKEDASNKVTSLSSSSTDTQYPSAKCVYDLVGDIETLLSNI